MNEIRNRIHAMRIEMLNRNLDAWYISGTDPHGSEYLPAHWETRAFISGFTGSYGLVIITQEDAGLWTDSRYFIQAAEELKGSGVKLFPLRVPRALAPEQWLVKQLKAGSRVGVDPQTVSVNVYRKLSDVLSDGSIELINTPDFFEKIWEDRPVIPHDRIFELAPVYAGLTRKEKKDLLLTHLRKFNADYQVITSLDELAWFFNLRGTDIPYNPVFTGYALAGKSETVLFVERGKLSSALSATFQKENIRIEMYSRFLPGLTSLKNKTILLDPSTCNQAIWDALHRKNEIREKPSPVASLKACKNKAELSGFREAMKKDGVALVEFLYWLKNNVQKEDITEYTAGEKIAAFRRKQKDYQGESFPPIVGYKEHGAIVHLSSGPVNALQILPEGILLFDSGGHYLQGTTDITRTVSLGKVSEKQKTDFTLVLKGMIALTQAVFPEGTPGCNLDVLARRALWEHGLNYGHGTGHGVGHFLNVHEGPVSVRQEVNPLPLSPGMVLSNEPGLYREGEYGIRCENMMVCVEKEETSFGRFLAFETLSLCPFDTSLLNKRLLTPGEIEWINLYHQRVREELMPALPEELKPFLVDLTREIL